MNKLDISVIIPVYNSSSTIKKCLSSVINELRDSSLKWEIIIIDDGSTDDTSILVHEVLKQEDCEANIIYIKQENKGAAEARNTGLKLAKGNLIAFNDSDDEWLEGKLKVQLQILNADKSIDMVGVLHGISNGNETFSIEDISFNKMLIKYRFPTPGVLFYRSVLDTIGFFPANRRNAEEGVFFYRMAFYKRCVLIKRVYTRNILGKHEIGITGLSGDVYKQSIGQFKNINTIYHQGLLSLSKYILVWFYNLVLMLRRLIKFYSRRII